MASNENDFFSEEEPQTQTAEPVMVPVVEVTRSNLNDDGDTTTSVTAAESFRSETSVEDGSEADITSRFDSRPNTSRSSAKTKGRNGKKPVDMTPPDIHLHNSEDSVERLKKLNKNDEAIKELIRCTAYCRILYGDGHWKLAQSHIRLGTAYLDLKGLAAQAVYHAEQSEKIMKSKVQLVDTTTDKPKLYETMIEIHCTMGRAFTALKKYREAERNLVRAEQLLQEFSKELLAAEESLDNWNIEISLAIAKLNQLQKKQDEAAAYYQKSLKLLENKHGRDSVELIPVYQNLGRVEQSRATDADHIKAIEYQLQAHSIATARYREGSVEIAESAYATAAAYSAVGDEDADTSAESYLNESLVIYQVCYGPNHTKTIQVQNELARLMIRSNRRDEGISMLHSTIKPKEQVYGDLSAEVAETWKLIGSTYLSMGEPEKAFKFLTKCHDMECQVYGASSKKSAETDKTIKMLLA